MPELDINSRYDNLLCTPVAKLGDWTFNEQVAQVFADMIQRSVPGYSTVITMTGMLARRLVQPYSHIYDLGCSLGASTLAILNNIQVSGCKIIAVDNSPAMIKRCRQHFDTLHTKTPIELIEASIQNIRPENASLIVLNFTLQFLEPAYRQHLIDQIYQGLLPGGVLVLSEKFSFEDSDISELLCAMHDDFKRANGYSELEISQKRRMLANVMLTDSVNTHRSRLHQAGFDRVDVGFQCLNFGSLIAIKSGKPA